MFIQTCNLEGKGRKVSTRHDTSAYTNLTTLYKIQYTVKKKKRAYKPAIEGEKTFGTHRGAKVHIYITVH